MTFNWTWPFYFLSLIPAVIILYMLKQKFMEQEISSTYLWDAVLRDIEVNTPWQKLKKNLLLLLQVLAILFFIFALSEPYLNFWGKSIDNLIVVIDTSGSMSAAYGEKTRLEESKERASKLIRSVGASSRISIISCGSAPKVELNSSTSKSEALKKISEIAPTNSSGSLEDTISLIKSMGKQYNSYSAVIYTDRSLDIKDINGELVSLQSEGDNVSLDYISHSIDEEGIKVLLRVTNRSTKALTREISLYGEDKVLDIKNVSLEKGETKTIYFQPVKEKFNTLYAEITEKDALREDNIIYDIISQEKSPKLLLVTEKNVFLEKALASINNIEVYRSNPGAKIIDSYDMYIFDSSLPEVMLESGNILFINPPKTAPIINVKENLKGGQVEILKHNATRYMENAYFAASEFKDIEVPYWAAPIFKIRNNIAGFIGDYKGRKVGVIAFDLHKSDFVLTSEFPIFINNITGELVDTGIVRRDKYNAGETVEINPLPEIKEIKVTTPSNKTTKLDIKYPIKPIDNIYETGIYNITVKNNDDTEKSNIIAVNFPTEESNINIAVESEVSGQKQNKTAITGMNMAFPLMLLLLLLLLIEWVVYTGGY